jgi:hypothetical protein
MIARLSRIRSTCPSGLNLWIKRQSQAKLLLPVQRLSLSLVRRSNLRACPFLRISIFRPSLDAIPVFDTGVSALDAGLVRVTGGNIVIVAMLP